MKLNLRHIVMAIFMAAIMVSNAGGLKPTSGTDWFVYSTDGEETYGFFNPGTGKTMYTGMLANVPTSIVDGVFIVNSDVDGLSVYSASDPKAPKPLGDLSGLRCVGNVSDGMLPVVRPGSRIEVYSVGPDKAELAFTLNPIDGKEIIRCNFEFVDGLLIIANEDGRGGAVDKAGRVAIPVKYLGLIDLGADMILAAAGDDPDQCDWLVINTKGEEVYRFESGVVPIDKYGDGCLIYQKSDGGMCLLYLPTKEEIPLPAEVQSLKEARGEYAIYVGDELYNGVLKIKDGKAEIVLKAIEQSLQLLPWDPSKIFYENFGANFYVQDADGNDVINFGDEYQYVMPYFTPNWKGYVAYYNISTDMKCACIDTNGKVITPAGDSEIYGMRIINANEFFINSVIESDYIDKDAFSSKFAEAISADGLCGYKLGSPANPYFPDDLTPQYGTGISFFDSKDAPAVNVGLYGSYISLTTKYCLAESVGENDANFVPDNPIESIMLFIECPYGAWEVLGDLIKQTIESKGFVLISETDEEIEYRAPNGDATLTITFQYSVWDTIELQYKGI